MASALRDAALIVLAGTGACVALGSLVTRWLARARWAAPNRYDDCPPLLPYQAAKQGIPAMGGIFVLTAGILVAAIAGGLAHREGWLILGVVVGLGAIGLVDDLLKLRGRPAGGMRRLPRLVAALSLGAILGMVLSSSAVSYRLVELPWLHRTVDLGWAWVPCAMLVVAGCAHSVNLADGLDGLAAGCVAIALAVLGIWAAAQQGTASAVLLPWCAALVGACIGFLWFNGFPASVFLGDVGALGLGGALAAISLMTHTALWLLVIGGVFVLEAVSVILQVGSYKLRGRRRIFRVAPIHHHFQLGGLSEPKLILRFWIIALLLGLAGLTAVRLP